MPNSSPYPKRRGAPRSATPSASGKPSSTIAAGAGSSQNTKRSMTRPTKEKEIVVWRPSSPVIPKMRKQGVTVKEKDNMLEVPGINYPVTISLPEGGPSERVAYVEYALDMLIHNLVGSGQLQASQAHLIKTPELREHIRKLADRAEKLHKEDKSKGTKTFITAKRSTHRTSTKWALQPNSLPITIITNKDPTAKPRAVRKNFSTLTSRSTRSASAGGTSKKYTHNVLRIPKKQGEEEENGKTSQKAHSYYSGLKGSNPSEMNANPIEISGQMWNAPTKTVPGAPSMMTSLDNYLLETATALEDQSQFKAKKTATGYKAKLDMRGFNNEEINLDLKGRVLTATANRESRNGLNPRKAVETLEFPEGVNLDNLNVARRVDGILVIQEIPPEMQYH